jgi:phosphoribosylamine--glycine ligase
VTARSGSTVLVIGSGGREHALALRLLASSSVGEVIVAPGNAGTHRGGGGKVLRNAQGDALAIARAERPDLIVIGPEAPLCEGVADRLGAAGFTVFGPSAAAARLEGSKAFMKDFARRMGMLTARHEVVTDASDVERAVNGFREPPVVKADGLCAGKGVVVAASHAEAIAAAREMLQGERFGDAGRTVVLEERIVGLEASAHAICDGERVLVLPAAQDHKRIGDGDTGPNTGGMGTIAPSPLVTPAMAARVQKDVFERAVRGMADEGNPFRGVLFAGLMIDAAGEPHLLEFNVRFGDPETQVLMNVIDGDLGLLLESAARGHLDATAIRVSNRHAACVVLAAAGYPGSPRAGDVIDGLDAAAAYPDVQVHHAGTRLDGDRVVTSGGRVLGVTASGRTLREAHDSAYRAVSAIRFSGMQYRRDIGAKAL